MRERGYFDHNATTPPDPRVVEVMRPWTGPRFGNPSSAHRRGRETKAALEEARGRVASMLGAEPADVVFTASGSEANNAVVFDVCRRERSPGEIVLSAFEHPSVTRAALRCESAGFSVRNIAPRSDGMVRAGDFEAALGPETRLACLMLANNVVGTLQPVREVARAARERGIPVLCDAVQAVGKTEVDVGVLGVDYLVLGGHKFHGPIGAAALWVRPDASFDGWLVGGEQEAGRRASTVNLPAAVGLGEACRLVDEGLPSRRQHLLGLREALEEGLEEISGVTIHAFDGVRLPHTTCVAFEGAPGAELGRRLDERGFAVSTGPACGSGSPRPAEALLSMGVSAETALSSLRISLGMTNTLDEVGELLAILAEEVAAIRDRRTVA